MKKFLPLLVAGALLTPLTAHATGFWLAGHVYCEGTGLPLPGMTIHVSGSGFSGDGVTDEYGYYEIALPEAGGSFVATAVTDIDETVVFPGGGAHAFSTNAGDPYLYANWVIASPTCSKPEGMCWMTGGGAKINLYFNGPYAEQTRRHNFGGNVYPGCSPEAGQGGQWNHVDHTAKLHFQAFSAVVERCGNVDGIPPGSDSPETPFNFIEFTGVGRVQGIKGNKFKAEPVYFWARVEDRNEPGSNGQRDGTLKDRYFIQAFTNPLDRNGSTLLLVDIDGDPSTIDPIQITDGNLQLHISSCPEPTELPAIERTALRGTPRTTPAEFWFAMSPNPATSFARIRFGLPVSGRASFRVFDVTGRMVREIQNSDLPAGEHSTSWDLMDTRGGRVGSGMYFVQMRLNEGLARTVRVVVP